MIKAKKIPLYDKQADFIFSNARITGFFAGRGAGKTFSGAAKVLLKARDGEPWLCVSPDSNVILNTTFPEFIEVATKYDKLIKYNKSPYPKAWFRTNDGGVATLIFRSGEVADKIRGANVAGLWMDEASIQHLTVFEIAIACLRHKEKMGDVILTATPRGKSHWTFDVFYQEVTPDDIERGYITFYEGRPHEVTVEINQDTIETMGTGMYLPKPNTKMVRASSYDNPFIDDAFAATVESQYTAGFAAQEIKGEFVDLGGLMFDTRNFRFWDRSIMGEIPRDSVRVRYWDLAGTSGGGDYTVGLRMARTPEGEYVIEDVVRGQWSPKVVRDRMVKTAEIDRELFDNRVTIYFEQQSNSAGKEQADQMIKMLAGFPVYRDTISGQKHRSRGNLRLPGAGKQTRALPLAAMVENRNVFLVAAAWNRAFLGEIKDFPESQYDDQVDAASGAFNKLEAKGGLSMWGPKYEKDNRLRAAANEVLAKRTGPPQNGGARSDTIELHKLPTSNLARRLGRSSRNRRR